MSDLPFLEHALYLRQDGGCTLLARSPGFRDGWLPEGERLCTGLGPRPDGVACPRCVFARPLGRKHVAVVQAADQGQDAEGRPGPLGFHVVVLPAELYAKLGGDPFFLTDRLSPPWSARGPLEPLPCPPPPPGRRPVAEVQQVLQAPNSATLLGGTQALLDGGKLVLERSAPDESVLRGLWTLLPTATRRDLWPATFAFGNALGFDALVVPRLDPSMFANYVLEEQAGDYPEGHYELAVQTAAEAGRQEDLDILFARRSYRDTKKIALFLLFAIGFLVVAFALIKTPPREKPDAFDLPPPAQFTPLSADDTRALADRLRGLANEVGAKPAPTVPVAMLDFGAALPGAGPLPAAALLTLDPNALPSELLQGLDQRLGTPDPKRLDKPLWQLGPVKRQLRGLLYKHRVAGYDQRTLSPTELVDRLRQKVVKDAKPGREP
jgi:hypothetical protein